MASQKQIDANRRNAGKSTGPVTARGKAAVARNAVTHGLTAIKATPPRETLEDIDVVREKLRLSFEPVGEVETNLVHQLAWFYWQAERASRCADGLLAMLERGEAFFRKSPLTDEFKKAPRDLAAMARHEVHLDNALTATMQELETLQAERRQNEKFKTKPIVREESAGDAKNEANSTANDGA